MPRYDVSFEGRTEDASCCFWVSVMAASKREAEYLGYEAARRKHRECDEFELISVRKAEA